MTTCTGPTLRGILGRFAFELARFAFFLSVLVGLPTLGWAQGPYGAPAPTVPSLQRPVVDAPRPVRPPPPSVKVAPAQGPLRSIVTAPVAAEKSAVRTLLIRKAERAEVAQRVAPAIREPLAGADTLVFPVGKFEMALGVSSPAQPGQAGYIDFAQRLKVHYYGELFRADGGGGGRDRFKTNLDTAIGSSKHIHFNLDGFDMERFGSYLADPISKDPKTLDYGNITNYELKSILSDPGLLSKTTFYGRDGKVVAAPKIPITSQRLHEPPSAWQ